MGVPKREKEKGKLILVLSYEQNLFHLTFSFMILMHNDS